jgi:hypothetical protein
MDDVAELVGGMRVLATEGTQFAFTGWTCVDVGSMPWVPDTTTSTWMQTSSAVPVVCIYSNCSQLPKPNGITAPIDGVTLTGGERVLVVHTDTRLSGIWIAATGEWTRAEDMNASGELSSGRQIRATSGTSFKDTTWLCTGTGADPWIPDTTTSTWILYALPAVPATAYELEARGPSGPISIPSPYLAPTNTYIGEFYAAILWDRSLSDLELAAAMQGIKGTAVLVPIPGTNAEPSRAIVRAGTYHNRLLYYSNFTKTYLVEPRQRVENTEPPKTSAVKGDLWFQPRYSPSIPILPPASTPTNFAGVADSISQTTLTWTDSTDPLVTFYDIRYNLTGAPVSDRDRLLKSNVVPGTQTTVHTLNSTEQAVSRIFYGLIGKTSKSSQASVTEWAQTSVPKYVLSSLKTWEELGNAGKIWTDLNTYTWQDIEDTGVTP